MTLLAQAYRSWSVRLEPPLRIDARLALPSSPLLDSVPHC